MSPLSHKEILRLLERLSPDQIRAREAERLDETGLALLEEREQELEPVEDCLRVAGRQFRENLSNPPPLKLLDSESFKKRSTWWGNKTPVWNWLRASAVLTLAAMMVIFALHPALQKEALGSEEKTRQPLFRGGNFSPADSELRLLDQKLSRVLMERAVLLYNLGGRTGERHYLDKALVDLLSALELDSENQETLRYLVLVHENLGNPAKAADYRGRMHLNPYAN